MIFKTASLQDNFKRNLTFSNSAREGWKAILSNLPKDSKILLPAYIGITDREGSGIYDPVVEMGISHDFYPLTNNLDVTKDALEYRIKKSKYCLILFVHYFGYEISEIESLIQLCKNNGLITVEDCAHLYNFNVYIKSNAGKHSDYTFFSLHKNFPFKKGGLIKQNNTNLPTPKIETKHDEELNSIKTNLISYDVNKIALKRRENYETYRLLLINTPLITPLKILKATDIPHNYPVLVSNELREKLYFWLIEKEVTLIALYYRLIPPLNTSEFNNMRNISNNILNLPLHQDITKEDIEKIVSLIKQGLKELTK